MGGVGVQALVDAYISLLDTLLLLLVNGVCWWRIRTETEAGL